MHTYTATPEGARTREGGSGWPVIGPEPGPGGARRVQGWTPGRRLPREAGAPLASFAVLRVQSSVGALLAPTPFAKRRRAPFPPPPPRLPLPRWCGRAFSPAWLPRLTRRLPPSAPRPPKPAPRGPSPRRGGERTRARAEPALERVRRAAGGGSRPGSARSPHPRRVGASPNAGLRAACVAAARGPQPRPRPRCGALPASIPAPAAEAAAAPGRLRTRNQVRGARGARPERARPSVCRLRGLLPPRPGAQPGLRFRLGSCRVGSEGQSEGQLREGAGQTCWAAEEETEERAGQGLWLGLRDMQLVTEPSRQTAGRRCR